MPNFKENARVDRVLARFAHFSLVGVELVRLFLSAVTVPCFLRRGLGEQLSEILLVLRRGAPPPEHCGGPRGYRLMLKRQQEGGAIADPASVEAIIQMLAWTHADQPARTWDLLRETLEGWRSIDRRLEQYGPLEPNRFSLKEANERLSVLVEDGRLRS